MSGFHKQAKKFHRKNNFKILLERGGEKAHFNNQTGKAKKPFKSVGEASKFAAWSNKKYKKKSWGVYKCGHCTMYHLTTSF